MSRAGVRWTREPLVHFAALGVVIFALQGALGGSIASAPRDTIVVDAGVTARLAAEHERREGAPPTDAELEAAIERWVADEALVAEARALGLDRGDRVVERRLAQKMEFLLRTEQAPTEPTDAELAALASARPPLLRVEHRAFRSDRADPTADAEAAVEALRAGRDAAGDPFIHGLVLHADADGLDARFGAGFAAALPKDGDWAVVPSRFGVHAARVVSREEFAEDRGDLVRRWQRAREDELLRARTRRLVERYTVRREDR